MNKKYEEILPAERLFYFSGEPKDVIDLSQLADTDMKSASNIWWKVLNACAGVDDYLAKGFEDEEEMKTARLELLDLFDALVKSLGDEFIDVANGVNQLGWVMSVRAANQDVPEV